MKYQVHLRISSMSKLLQTINLLFLGTWFTLKYMAQSESSKKKKLSWVLTSSELISSMRLQTTCYRSLLLIASERTVFSVAET